MIAVVNDAKNAIYNRNFPDAQLHLDSAKVQLDFIPHSLYATVYYSASVTYYFFFQAEDGIRDGRVTGVQTCALPIVAWRGGDRPAAGRPGGPQHVAAGRQRLRRGPGDGHYTHGGGAHLERHR